MQLEGLQTFNAAGRTPSGSRRPVRSSASRAPEPAAEAVGPVNQDKYGLLNRLQVQEMHRNGTLLWLFPSRSLLNLTAQLVILITKSINDRKYPSRWIEQENRPFQILVHRENGSRIPISNKFKYSQG